MLLCVLVPVAYFGMGVIAFTGSFLFYYLLTAMRGLQGPVMRMRLQEASERRNRASILSLHSLVFRLGFVLTGPLVGRLADAHGFSTGFLSIGIFFALTLPLAGWYFLRHSTTVSDGRM